MDGKLCSNASAGKAPEATLAAALILSFFLRITVSMPAPSPPLHRGQGHDCRRQKLSPAIVETGSTAAFGFDSRSKRCETLHSDSRQSYEDHLRRLRPINDIFPFGSVTLVRFMDPRKQAAGFGECLEQGATAP